MANAFGRIDEFEDDNELCLIDAGIKSFLDIPLPENLQVLNVHCNVIRVIENLDHLRLLKHLDLSSNQITTIEGLDSLGSLRTLNLACNLIQRVHGFSNLRSVVKLNLSYNQISDLSGLQVIQGKDFALSHVELQGNQVQSVSHVCRCLKGCENLRHLIFSQSGASNPICHQQDYRSSVLSTLPMLSVLDATDRSGYLTSHDDVAEDIPGLEQYMDYLLTSSSSDMQPIRRAFPRIEAAMEAYRQRGVTTPEMSTLSEQDTSPASGRFGKKSNSDRNEQRLEKLELQLENLLSSKEEPRRTERSRVNSTPLLKAKRDVDDTDESDQSPSKGKTRPRNRRPLVKKMEKKTNVAKRVDDDESKRDDIRKTYANMVSELDSERDRRWKAEMASKKLSEKIQQLQTEAMEEREMQTVAVGATSRLKEIVSRERDARHRQQAELETTQNKLSRFEEENERLQRDEAEMREALRMAEDTSNKTEREGLQQQAHMAKRLQESVLRAAAMSRETELLKAAAKTSKLQLQQLQELLADREHQHRKDMENRFALHSPEMKEALTNETKRLEEIHAQELHNHRQRVESLSKQYQALEDEFRQALMSEETRFEQLQRAFESTSRENAANKQALLLAKERDDKSVVVTSELTSMIKEQKGRISELSKAKHEQTHDMKERIHSMEAQLDEARRRMVQLELLKKENVKLQSDIQGQESIIQGLKSERRLWGEELAQQGASLAHDRGRLESKIETLSSELNLMRAKLEREADAVRIKTKMIEDQTETIRKLKEAVLERDEEIRTAREEGLKTQRDLEEQLATESAVNTDIQEQNDRLTNRKEELKQRVNDLQDKLDESEETHRSLGRKWQEKSGLIGQLEQQVTAMRDTWAKKEDKMAAERDRAVDAASVAVDKLKSVDDAFRHQLDSKEENHQRELVQLRRQNEAELDSAHRRVAQVEDEMRELLKESEGQKKQMEEKVKKLSRAFSDLNQDLA